MKPTKNRVYCNDCGRQKMLFETEKKADTFLKFNSEEIESDTGYCPQRSYFCISCNGWHVTSTKGNDSVKSRTEMVMELYEQREADKALIKERNAEIRKIRDEKTKSKLEDINKRIEMLEFITEKQVLSEAINALNKDINELVLSKKKIGLLKNKISEIVSKMG